MVSLHTGDNAYLFLLCLSGSITENYRIVFYEQGRKKENSVGLKGGVAKLNEVGLRVWNSHLDPYRGPVVTMLDKKAVITLGGRLAKGRRGNGLGRGARQAFRKWAEVTLKTRQGKQALMDKGQCAGPIRRGRRAPRGGEGTGPEAGSSQAGLTPHDACGWGPLRVQQLSITCLSKTLTKTMWLWLCILDVIKNKTSQSDLSPTRPRP